MVRLASFMCLAFIFTWSSVSTAAPPVFLNTGAVDCLHEIVGVDKCPDKTSTPSCPEGSFCENFPSFGGYSCWNSDLYLRQTVERTVVDTTSTVPKWSSPPCNVEGKEPALNPDGEIEAYLCGYERDCFCLISEYEPYPVCTIAEAKYFLLAALLRDADRPCFRCTIEP